MGSTRALAGDGCMASTAAKASAKRAMGSSAGAAIARRRANGRGVQSAWILSRWIATTARQAQREFERLLDRVVLDWTLAVVRRHHTVQWVVLYVIAIEAFHTTYNSIILRSSLHRTVLGRFHCLVQSVLSYSSQYTTIVYQTELYLSPPFYCTVLLY